MIFTLRADKEIPAWMIGRVRQESINDGEKDNKLYFAAGRQGQLIWRISRI